MYIDTAKSKQHGKIYTRYLLRENYRENGKVKHRTIANLTHCTAEEITAIKLALKHKHNLNTLTTEGVKVKNKQGVSVGADWLLLEVAKKLGIVKALGNSKNGKLAIMQIIARIIDQGSRLSAVRLASQHAISDILGITELDEDDLYSNLDWLAKEQVKIEQTLFKQTEKKKPSLFLYDVTSSYLEGECNELAAHGYNRDGKKGKLQIVIGLLCDEDGIPLSIEVFTGNTQDMKTVSSQIEKIAERYKAKNITLVGDRGMIKQAGIEELKKHGYYHITAVTKPQIEKMLNNGMIQLSLFDESIQEIEDVTGERFLLRRNPIRAKEIEDARTSKLAVLEKLIKAKNQYLQEHTRAKAEKALQVVIRKAEQLKIADWLVISEAQRIITYTINERQLLEKKHLDGCYVIKTDLPKSIADKETIHKRYKDLTLVEQAFRMSKTVLLELRPIYVRLASRTKGHALVVMLAYRIIKELSEKWKNFDLTVEEGIKKLTTLCTMEVTVNDHTHNQIPTPNDLLQQLFKAADIVVPEVLPKLRLGNLSKVATKKKLLNRR